MRATNVILKFVYDNLNYHLCGVTYPMDEIGKQKLALCSWCVARPPHRLDGAHFYFYIMDIETIQVTPEIAKEMLGANTDNRKQTTDHVNFLAAQMADGKWKFCADPIRYGKSGRLIDGQHRLLAVIKSNTTQQFVVIRGLDDSVFDVFDSGRNRKASDVLSIEKIQNSVSTAALIGKILNYRMGLRSALSGMNNSGGGGSAAKGNRKISNATILEFARANDLSDFVKFGAKCSNTLSIFTTTEYAFFKYVFDEISEDDSFMFLEKLASGVGLSQGSPILLLRNRMIENKTNTLKMTSSMKLNLVFKAWNYFRENKEMKVLQYSQSEKEITPK